MSTQSKLNNKLRQRIEDILVQKNFVRSEPIAQLIDDILNEVNIYIKELEKSSKSLKDKTDGKEDGDERYRSMFWNNHAVMLMIDPETGMIEDVNPAAQNYYGWAHSDLCGMNINEINTLSPEEVTNELQLAKKQKRKYFHFKHKLRNGEVRDVSVFSGPISYKGKTLLFSIVHDETNRNRAENALKEQMEFLETLMHTIPNPVYYKDIDGNYVGCNRAFEHFFGVKQSDIISRNVFHLNILKISEDLHAKDMELLQNRSNQNFECVFHFKDGRIRNVLYDKATLHNPRGEAIGILGVITDITYQKLAKEEITRNTQRLHALVKIFEYQTDSMTSLLNFALGEALKLTESVMGCIYLYDHNNDCLNLASCSSTNGRENEILPETCYGMNDASVWTKVAAEQREIVSNEIDNTENKADNQLINFRYTIIPIISNDRLEAVVGVSRKETNYTETDLHQLKLLMNSVWGIAQRMEDSKKISKLSIAVEQSSASVVITDTQGSIEYVNSKFSDLTGYRAEEAIGKNPNILKSDYQDKEFYKQLWSTILSGKEWRGQFMNRKKDGGLYWESASISPIKNSKGEIINFIGIKEDITELKRTEFELRESEEKLQAIFNNSLQSFAIFSPDLKLQAFNRIAADRAKQFFGTNYMLGTHILELYPSETTKSIVEVMQRVLNGEIVQYENHLIDDQQEYWFDYHFSPVIGANGMINSIFFTSLDITHLKQAEASISEALRREKELSDLKSRFVSTVSHEFRTPLASIYSNAQLLQRYLTKWDEGKQNLVFNRIYESVNNLTGMLEDVSLIGKEQSGKFTYRPEVLNLNEFVHEVISEVHNALTQENMVELTIDHEYSRVLFDRVLLRHILSNVLGNAIKYSPGFSRVHLSVERQAESLVFTVQDSGVGIPEEELQYVFDPFFRASNSEEFKGTGLGMSIVKQCVDIHGGELTIQSELNHGTTVRIRLPLRLIK